jgi:hypothetical protein
LLDMGFSNIFNKLCVAQSSWIINMKYFHDMKSEFLILIEQQYWRNNIEETKTQHLKDRKRQKHHDSKICLNLLSNLISRKQHNLNFTSLEKQNDPEMIKSGNIRRTSFEKSKYSDIQVFNEFEIQFQRMKLIESCTNE